MNSPTAHSCASAHVEPGQEAAGKSRQGFDPLAQARLLIKLLNGALSLLLSDVEADVASPMAHGFAVEDPDHPYHKSVAGARAALALVRGDASASLDFLENDGAADVLPHFLIVGGRVYWSEPLGALDGSRCLMRTGLDAETGAIRWDEGIDVLETECIGGDVGYAAIESALFATEGR